MLLLAGCQGARDRGDQYAQTAQLMLEAGRYDEANKAISDAIAERDDVVGYYMLKGQIEVATGSLIKAFQTYQLALDLDPSNQEALSFVANLGLRIGRIDQASEAAERLLVLDPASVSALQVRGLVALQRQHLDEAQAAAEKILSISPSDEGGALIQARVLAMQGKIEEAEALIVKTEAVIGDTPASLTTLLNMARREGNADKMANLFPRLLAKSPDDLRVAIDYSNFLYKTGKYDQARQKSFDVLRKSGGKKEIYDAVIRLWSEFEQRPFSDADLTQIAPADPFAVQEAMRYLLFNRQAEQVLRLAARANSGGANLIPALIGRAQLQKGFVDQARAVAKSVLGRDDGNNEGLLLAAELALHDRNADLALQKAQLALRDDPLNPGAYAVVARAYAARKQDIRAVQIYDDGRDRLPQNHYLSYDYENFLIKIGDKARAISVARDFVANSPASIRGWSRLIDLCTGVDAGCISEALAGREDAIHKLQLDDPPGTLPDRGLFGKF